MPKTKADDSGGPSSKRTKNSPGNNRNRTGHANSNNRGIGGGAGGNNNNNNNSGNKTSSPVPSTTPASRSKRIQAGNAGSFLSKVLDNEGAIAAMIGI